MRHLDLFSGIGGFALAAQWTWGDEYETVAFCEIDKFCHKVLRKNFGDVPIYEDIKKLNIDNIVNSCYIQKCHHEWHKNNKPIARKEVPNEKEVSDAVRIDLLTGGFP